MLNAVCDGMLFLPKVVHDGIMATEIVYALTYNIQENLASVPDAVKDV